MYGYELTGPDGEHVDSCWGFYGDDDRTGYMMDQARDLINYDAEKRLTTAWIAAEKTWHDANLVGAGFVGVI